MRKNLWLAGTLGGLFILILVISFVVWPEQEAQAPETPPLIVNPIDPDPSYEDTKDPNDMVEPNVPSNITVAHFTDFDQNEEEVHFKTYENNVFRLLYESSLRVQELDGEVSFYDEGEGLYFRVQSVQDPFTFQENIQPEMDEKGYRLVASDDWDNGQSYLYYNDDLYYHNRYAIDVYLLEKASEQFYVMFICPFDHEEKYPSRFEYMLDSIEIVSPSA